MRQATLSFLIVVSCAPSRSKTDVASPANDGLASDAADESAGATADGGASAPQFVISHGDELRVLQADGTVVARLPVTEVQSAVAVSPDGRLLASGRGFAPSQNGWTKDGDLWVWQIDSRFSDGAEVRPDFELKGHKREMIVSVAFTADSARLMSLGDRGRLILWDVAAREEVKRWKVPYAVAASMSPDGKWFVTHHLDGVRLWSIDSAKGNKFDLPASCLESAFAPESNRFAVACKNVIYEFELPSMEPVREFETDLEYGRGVSYSREHLAALDKEKDVIVWERDSGKVALTIAAGDKKADEAFRLTFDPRGRVLGVAYCNELRGFDVSSKQRIFSVSLPPKKRCRPALTFVPR
jgi:WD40 repeat protein